MAQKKFDCVEMKDRIQAEMLREYEGLSDEEVRERIQLKLETSDSVVAKKWRKMQSTKLPSDAR